MKKRNSAILLIVLAFLGSFVNFYTTNFILSDVSNLTYGFGNRPHYIFASLPGFNLSLILVLLTIFLMRYIRHPEYLKRMSKLYIIIGMCFSLIGLVSAVLAGILVYNTFTAPNPFPGYLIISIVLFSLLLLAGTFFFIFVYKRMKDDESKRQMKGRYVFFTIMLCITVFYAYNRFGALLWSCSYADGPTLFMTWPFYVSLLLPLAILVHTELYAFDFYKKHCLAALIVISVITGLFVISTVYIVCLGAQNTTFISVISPAMGASRLLAKPIDIIGHTVIFGIAAVYALVHSIKYYKKHKEK